MGTNSSIMHTGWGQITRSSAGIMRKWGFSTWSIIHWQTIHYLSGLAPLRMSDETWIGTGYIFPTIEPLTNAEWCCDWAELQLLEIAWDGDQARCWLCFHSLPPGRVLLLLWYTLLQETTPCADGAVYEVDAPLCEGGSILMGWGDSSMPSTELKLQKRQGRRGGIGIWIVERRARCVGKRGCGELKTKSVKRKY